MPQPSEPDCVVANHLGVLTHAGLTDHGGGRPGFRRPPLWPASECPGAVSSHGTQVDCNGSRINVWKCDLCQHRIVIDETNNRLINEWFKLGLGELPRIGDLTGNGRT